MCAYNISTQIENEWLPWAPAGGRATVGGAPPPWKIKEKIFSLYMGGLYATFFPNGGIFATFFSLGGPFLPCEGLFPTFIPIWGTLLGLPHYENF